MRPFLALLLSLALTAPAWGQKAVIVGPDRVPAGSSVLLDGRQSEGKRLLWRLVEGDDATLSLTFDKDGRENIALFVPVAPAGELTYALIAIGEPDANGEPTLDVALKRVQVGAPEPPPAPEPAPGPTPGPTPTVKGALYVSYVVGADPTPAESAIRSSPAVRASLDGLDAVWRTYRSDDPAVSRLNLSGHVSSAGGPPSLLIQDETGAVLSTLHAPTIDQITAAVGAYRGK